MRETSLPSFPNRIYFIAFQPPLLFHRVQLPPSPAQPRLLVHAAHGERRQNFFQFFRLRGGAAEKYRKFFLGKQKTDHDATFMRMKEDAMNNGQTKPGYNLQLGTENQFILDFGLFQSPGDPLTMITFFNSFAGRYHRLPDKAVADSGYGSEENYRFMEEAGIAAYVKYNWFHREHARVEGRHTVGLLLHLRSTGAARQTNRAHKRYLREAAEGCG